MRYVVYHVDSIRYEVFDTLTAAKRSCTNKNKKAAKSNAERALRNGNPLTLGKAEYAYTDLETFDRDINFEVDTYNMMDPERKPIKIRRSQLGGCCDPATETYHSM